MKPINKPAIITNADADRIRVLLSPSDRLIFDFAIETGLRISDILKIRQCEIAKTMQILESKTQKYKVVELSDDLFSRLPKGFHAFGFYPYAFFSPRTRYKPLHRSTYHRRLKRASTALKIAFSAHSTRKLYALNIFERTNDIFQVQKALNHKYLTTTCTYLGIDLMKIIQEATKKEVEK